MAIIEKKIAPKFFELILSGEKNFDVRLGDFECKKGDTLVIREFDSEKKSYTGREIRKEVTYVAKLKEGDHWTKEEVEKYGYQVIGFT